jgi:hypothetical protein
MPAQTAVIRQEVGAQLPAAVDAATSSLWIGCNEFADLAGIARQNAHVAMTHAINGKPWRGSNLEVRTAENGKGLQVFIPSLPPILRETWKARNPGIMEAPAVDPVPLPPPSAIDSDIGARVAEMRWKLAIIAPALAYPKGSHARAAVLEEIAAGRHADLRGKPVTLHVDTLRDWLKTIEEGNESALARPRRADAGQRRSFICRAWDKACPLPDTQKTAIAAAFVEHVRGLWRSGASEKKILPLATTELQALSIDAGWIDAPRISPGLHAIRRHAEVRKLAIKETDAKRFHDKLTPRIHRSREGLQPMDIVIGDVHPDDHLMPDDGVHQTTHRMIAWLDLATNDLFVTLKLYPKGKSVTQADIAASFVEMVQAWGLPRTLYLDNGSEYNWADMIAGFERLQGLTEGFRFFVNAAAEGDATETAAPPRAVVRAKPYNAQAKPIEGAFSCLEKFKAIVPGYIGGDRMKKKTHNVGKPPKPYPGTPEHYREKTFPEILAFYRNEPQVGTMGGKSPNQRKREAIEAGWRPFTAGYEIFLFAFASSRRCKVHPGGIELDGTWFQSADIVPRIGEYIEVRYAKWDGAHALWIDDAGRPILIPRARYFHPLDIEGAREQALLNGFQTRHVRQLAATAPRVDTVAAMARHNAALPPAPDTPPGIPIILDGESKRIVDAIGEARAAIPPATPLPEAAPFDLYALPPPQKEKPAASADAPGFDIYDLCIPAPKPQRKEAA